MQRILLFLFFLPVLNFFSFPEFWLMPDKFVYKRGELISIRLMSGENLLGKNWNENKVKIQNLEFYFGGVKDRDMSNALTDKNGDSIQISMLDEGTAMVSLKSENFYKEYNAEEFNGYLRKQGLKEVLEYRVQKNDTDKPAKEFYQRCVKTIFQVGDKTDKTFKEKTNMAIDIIPDEHPYTIPKDGNFSVKIFFQGRPLSGSKIKVCHNLNDKFTVKEYNANAEGKIKFFLITEGRWMISTVKMIRLENDPKAEWQTYWSSLTWGYQ